MKYLFAIILLFNLSYGDTLIEENATITHVADGDTFDVRRDGDDSDKRIRFTGIQAMEIHPSAPGTPNDCWADEARERLIELTGGVGGRVILRAKNPNTEIRYRLARHIFVDNNGTLLNVSEELIKEGLAFAFPHATEDTYNQDYLMAQQYARENKIGLWSYENHCPTPADSNNTKFEFRVNYDADGDDEANLNDEWIKLKNVSGRRVDISKWWLRDSALNFFRFPDGTVLDDNEEITIYGGHGTNSNGVFYWGNDEPLLDNQGDGVFLLDYLDDSNNSDDDIYPKGNIKASFVYPCVGECPDQLKGKIKIVAHYDADGDDNLNLNGEWIKVTNISDDSINLKDYVIHSAPKGSDSYFFKNDTILDSHNSLYLYIGSGQDSDLVRYWDKNSSILDNTSDSVWIESMDGRVIDKFEWPDNNYTDSLDGKVKIDARYDADGDDETNLNGEWVRITNISNDDINLKDHIIYSAPDGSDNYMFKEDTILAAGEQLYLFTGSGTDSRLKKYWNKTYSVLANNGDKVWLAYLNGHIVSSTYWPQNINDPLIGKIDLNVHYDADGNDDENLNGEWIKIKNISNDRINLKDYIVTSDPKGSDSYWFKEDTFLDANSSFTLYIGSGSDTNNSKYWGKTKSILANDHDKVTVLNMVGTVIDKFEWPCGDGCSDPLQGKIKIDAHYDANGDDETNLNDEWVRITNISNETIDLKDYILHSEPEGSDSYTFTNTTQLKPNEELYLYTGDGTDSNLTKYWHKNHSVLANNSDRVWIDTSDGILIAEKSWPCVINCNNELENKVKLVAFYDAEGDDNQNLNGEWVRITNISNGSIDLKDHTIYSLPKGSDNYVFRNSTVIDANESLYLYLGDGEDSRLAKYWHKTSDILANDGDSVILKTLDGYKITDFSWPQNQETPSLSSKIEIVANYDAEGNDNDNPNGEWVRITNISGEDINLKDYILHSLPEGSDHYLFREDTIVHPNEELFVHIGSGTDSRLVKYWGKTKGILANSGDKVWLSTMAGAIVKEFSWPCDGDCADSLDNKIDIVAKYDADGNDSENLNDEWIRIYNKSDDVINLKDYTINSAPAGSDKYTFTQNTILDKGESLYLHTGDGTDTLFDKYWHKNSSVLANDSDSVWLSNFSGKKIKEFSWPCENNCEDKLKNKVSLNVQYDAVGNDDNNPNGEWITINNDSNKTINIRDYIIKMNSRNYYFKDNTLIDKKSYIRLFVGNGANNGKNFYWGNNKGILPNSGGKVDFVNSRGVLVYSRAWPCDGNCSYDAPIEITSVNYDAQGDDNENPNGEWIILKNTSGYLMNLRDWEVSVRGYQYHFMNDLKLPVNTEVYLYIGDGNDTNYQRYWGFDSGILRNGGDVVKLYNPERVLSHCYSWGSEADTCSNILDSDNDGILNKDDDDDDGDGVIDSEDAFPLSAKEWADFDNDGIGDNADTDDDNDGISDDNEIKYGLNPKDPNDADLDNDGDGISNKDEINNGSNPNDRNSPNVNYVKDDFNDDGISDILWRNGSKNHLWVMSKNGDHTYVNIGSKSSAYTIAGISDFNADGAADILWRDNNQNLYLWYINKDLTHNYKKITPTSYTVVAIADFNKDDIADILLRKGSKNKIWYMKKDGTHISQYISSKSTSYKVAGYGDFNGDGITDILWRKGYSNYIWYMNSDGSHNYKKISSKSYKLIAVADFNKDGIADILWRKGSSNNIWYMNSDGSHNYKNIGSKSTKYTIAKVADFNGDGIADILWRKDSSNYIWYINSDGSHNYKRISNKTYNYVIY